MHENSLEAHKCLPHITLLGRLMDTFQRLRKSFFHFYGETIDYISFSFLKNVEELT